VRRARKGWIQNRHRCVVRLQGFGLENLLFHPLEKRTDKLGAPPHQFQQFCRDTGLTDVAAVYPFLDVQRKMIAILADDHVAQQPRSRGMTLSFSIGLPASASLALWTTVCKPLAAAYFSDSLSLDHHTTTSRPPYSKLALQLILLADVLQRFPVFFPPG